MPSTKPNILKPKNGIEYSLINLSAKGLLVLLSQREGRVPALRVRTLFLTSFRGISRLKLCTRTFLFSARSFHLSILIYFFHRPFVAGNDFLSCSGMNANVPYNVSESLPSGVGKPYLLKKDLFADP
jgi:hypothetical protein